MPVTQPPQNRFSVEGHKPLVEKLIKAEAEIAAIWERLKERGYGGSYSSLYRFLRLLHPLEPVATVRVETPPAVEGAVGSHDP